MSVVLGAGADASTFTGILDLAGQLVTFLITQMGAFLKFVTDNPIVLVFLLLTLAGAAIGFLKRTMHTA